jgi:membrane protein
VLIWVYYSAQLVLLGAEFTRVYACRYGSRRGSARAGAQDPGRATGVPA